MTRTVTLVSGGRTIHAEVFDPRDSVSPHPVVILIHGADGLQSKEWIDRYHRFAGHLAANGCAVVFPHYFERTGTTFTNMADIIRNFTAWMGAISDTTAWATANLKPVDGRVGLAGCSLGASLVLAEAAQDARAGAVVEYFGAMPDWAARAMTRMPPTLILHGEKDPLVSVKEAARLQALLKEKSVPCEVHLYPGQGHGFSGEAEHDGMARMTAFFHQHLGK